MHRGRRMLSFCPINNDIGAARGAVGGVCFFCCSALGAKTISPGLIASSRAYRGAAINLTHNRNYKFIVA